MSRIASVVMFSLLLLGGGRDVRADVVDSATGGFALKTTIEIAAPAATVYRALGQIGAWWNSAHTWSGSASNMSIELTPGGCFCERLPNGGVRHMTVTFVDAPKTLHLHGGLGPLAAMAVEGSMVLTLTEAAGKTTLVAIYNVGGYAPSGLASLAAPVDFVVKEQIGRLKAFVESPPK